MAKFDNVACYLTMITRIKDELEVAGETVQERIWDDFTQQETRIGSKHEGKQKGEEE